MKMKFFLSLNNFVLNFAVLTKENLYINFLETIHQI